MLLQDLVSNTEHGVGMCALKRCLNMALYLYLKILASPTEVVVHTSHVCADPYKAECLAQHIMLFPEQCLMDSLLLRHSRRRRGGLSWNHTYLAACVIVAKERQSGMNVNNANTLSSSFCSGMRLVQTKHVCSAVAVA